MHAVPELRVRAAQFANGNPALWRLRRRAGCRDCL